ncbi:MAG: pyrroloquinoline quinone biosynthesis protein B [Crocinitomix sp.]|jgi:pyrroloquinoline quinone biosynthesis protein B
MSSFTKTAFLFCGMFVFFQCGADHEDPLSVDLPIDELVEEEGFEGVKLVVLGTVQDAGSPQIACQKSCCANLFEHPDATRMVASLGLIDGVDNKTYLFDASPDLPAQLEILNRKSGSDLSKTPDGIFLTHAHIGHYTGLMYLGKEAMNAKSVPVYAMPRMKEFLQTNGPWSQLVANKNIALKELRASDTFGLGKDITVTPLIVPHRDEFSETVGFIISGPNKTALFIPDIDKWEKWDQDIVELVKKVDIAFLDATFYDAEEINNRDISEIPHPFVVESMKTFAGLGLEDRNKIYLIHFNHTNPLLRKNGDQIEEVLDFGFNIAETEMVFNL